MEALGNPSGSTFQVAERGLRRTLAWSKPGLQEPSSAITGMNFVIETNQDRHQLTVCDNELPLMVGVAGHDLYVLECKTQCQDWSPNAPSYGPGSRKV